VSSHLAGSVRNMADATLAAVVRISRMDAAHTAALVGVPAARCPLPAARCPNYYASYAT